MPGNPNPVRPPEFLAKQKPKYGDRPLAGARSVRLPEDVDAQLAQMPNRQQFMRDAIEAALTGEQQSRTQPQPQQSAIDSATLQAQIDAVLMTVKPSERRAAKALFKKLTDRLG